VAPAAERRLMRIVRPLDRYILGQFFRIFLVTATGFPILVILIDATDNLGRYLQRDIPVGKVALSYLYFAPESLFMVLPASVLFATVFTIGSLTRHSEVTAAKASGISFYRLILPIAFGASLATGIGVVVGETVPVATARRNEIIGEKSAVGTTRYNFAYSSEGGRVYTVGKLEAFADSGRMHQLEIRRRGTGADFPTTIAIAADASWRPATRSWVMRDGALHIVSSDTNVMTLRYETMRDPNLRERPEELRQRSSLPDEMQRAELGRYIAAMERSGVDVNTVRVERALRLAIPATCVIIFLFGAPLATSNQRGGAAFGVGIALATTVLFLMLVQLTKAIGGNGFVVPELAAWIPGGVFVVAGMVLLAKVRT
jgi:lipopolysaccharide export system permease protein